MLDKHQQKTPAIKAKLFEALSAYLPAAVLREQQSIRSQRPCRIDFEISGMIVHLASMAGSRN
jgi:hypothetical protein